ncbi:ribosomal protein S18 [Colletotrichum musicola]|uniref:Small ribosomal subunit protein bS18m n=1 Tax=Colletotrichum musicola TaxID=2175873 RepID=A0A8H6U974_9PEZI|nr:ribosomal protein S18 [Colletotrichum musicola]
MPPRLLSLPAFTASSAFMARVARSFSATPIVANQSSSDPSNPFGLFDAPAPKPASPAAPAAPAAPSNPISNLLNLDEKPKVHSADRIRELINRGGSMRADSAVARKRTMLQSLRDKKISDDFLKQMPRRWKNGDVYAPHDLSPVEMTKFRKPRRPDVDIVDMLGINPKDYYRNFSVISEFMTPAGQIMDARETGLRGPNHRRMAKAIRRAIGMGIHPSIHYHPEILRKRFRLQNTWK